MEGDRNDAACYYCFDDAAREVRLTRHDTPTPWINYLSNGTFHAFLSQAGGGLAFYKSPQIWRITRYRFFHLPTDRSGPYVYIQDADTGEYWCPTYEPAGARPDRWEAAHGLGYTRFRAERAGIAASLVYFIGEDENALIWNLKLMNTSGRGRRVRLFAYVEFGMMEFMRELQWQCYNKHQVSVTYSRDSGALIYKYGVENQPKPAETPLVYFASDTEPGGYDGDRDEFIGSYRSESNPYAIEHDGCGNSTLLGGDPCGALQFDIVLGPSQEHEVNIFLGAGMDAGEIAAALENLRKPGFVRASFEKLTAGWKRYLGAFACSLPDGDAERMINTWNPYQAQRNFLFSRNISYYATGTFRGVGFRDTSQDILALIPFDAEASKEKTRVLLRQQYRDGHANHYFFPHEGWDPVTTVHSDDHLWPVWAVWGIVMETGDASFLEEKVGFYDEGEASVYGHLKRAVEFTLAHLGPNGFPLMLRSDWNDQLFRVCRQGKGESIWTAMQFGAMLLKMAELARLGCREEDAASYLEAYEKQKSLVNALAWDGKWYRRAVMDDGSFLGTDAHGQAKIWLNAQTWAVISGMAEGKRGLAAMDSVRELLDTPLGIKKIHPPITDFPSPEDPLTNYNPGTGENGAVFCHANTWAIIAECMLGRGDAAYKYYRQLIPSVAMERAGAWRYKAEPYVYSSNIFGPDSDKFGLANVSWLTGTAAWMYVAASQYILGIRPCREGLKIDPCIPKEWKTLKVSRLFRGCEYEMEIVNASGVSCGVSRCEADGVRIEGNVIPHVQGRKKASVKIVI